MEHRKAAYTAMLLKGTLWAHLTEIDRDDGIDENVPEHRLAARSWNAEQIKEVSAGTILDFIEKMPGLQVMGRRVLYLSLIHISTMMSLHPERHSTKPGDDNNYRHQDYSPKIDSERKRHI